MRKTSVGLKRLLSLWLCLGLCVGPVLAKAQQEDSAYSSKPSKNVAACTLLVGAWQAVFPGTILSDAQASVSQAFGPKTIGYRQILFAQQWKGSSAIESLLETWKLGLRDKNILPAPFLLIAGTLAIGVSYLHRPIIQENKTALLPAIAFAVLASFSFRHAIKNWFSHDPNIGPFLKKLDASDSQKSIFYGVRAKVSEEELQRLIELAPDIGLRTAIDSLRPRRHLNLGILFQNQETEPTLTVFVWEP